MFLGFTGLCVWAINECERNLENSQSLHLKCLLSFSEDVSHLQVHTMLCFSIEMKEKTVSIGFELCPKQFRSVTHVVIMAAAASLLSTLRWLLTLLTLSESVLKQVISVFCTQAFHRRTYLMLYCYTIDCFWWVWGSWWFMHQNSNSKSRCTLCKNLLIGRVLYVSQKSGYHLREGLLHICCLWWVPVVLVCWVWIWDLERGPPLGQSVAFFACISAQSFIPNSHSFPGNISNDFERFELVLSCIEMKKPWKKLPFLGWPPIHPRSTMAPLPCLVLRQLRQLRQLCQLRQRHWLPGAPQGRGAHLHRHPTPRANQRHLWRRWPWKCAGQSPWSPPGRPRAQRGVLGCPGRCLDPRSFKMM